MRSFLSIARSGVQDPVECAVQAYHVRCGSGGRSLEQFWAEREPSEISPSILAAVVKADLQRRFGLGERPRAAEYLEKFSILSESGDRVVSLVYEEFCLLKEYGEGPDSREFCEGYGPWRDSLLSQLAYHRELSQAAGSEGPRVDFPKPGDRFDKYQLQSILGTGGVARVFLATEDDLGGRKVAIKVSAAFGQEPSILAKLDHRNIVPILTVARSESGLRGICMPYRQGVTLDKLIKRIGPGTPPRSARAIWKALEPSDPTEKLPEDDQRTGWEQFPIDRTFSEAVAWIGLALANALTYLHGRGILHRDIKPANVLLAYSEGPQLLDFNLSQDPGSPENVNAALKGGTLPYMAPEQLRAFLDPEGWTKVEAAADLYSLGLVLQELLTGQPPEVPPAGSSLPRGVQSLLDLRNDSRPSIREVNPSVPPALASIIEKCLVADPSGRYEGAAALAEDLKLFLARKPLEHASNPSKVERASNWIYRNRALVLMATPLMLILLLIYSFQAPSMMARVEKGEVLLDSDRPGDLERARLDFEKLYHDFPKSAWPSLYLSLTLEKIGGWQAKNANGMIQEASSRIDAEDALRGRLRKDPNSPKILTNLGICLLHKGDLSQAREIFRRAIEAEDARSITVNRFVTLAGLADVERKSQNPEESAQILWKASDVGGASMASDSDEASKVGWDKIYQIHNAMLPLYMKQADRILEKKPVDRDRVLRLLERQSTALEACRGDWEKMRKPASIDVNRHNFTVEVYESSIASSRAVLAADLHDRAQVDHLSEQARRRLRSADEILLQKLGNRDSLRKFLAEQQQKLEKRLRSFGSGKVEPNDSAAANPSS